MKDYDFSTWRNQDLEWAVASVLQDIKYWKKRNATNYRQAKRKLAKLRKGSAGRIWIPKSV